MPATITDVTVTPPKPPAGTEFTVQVTIERTGPEPADVVAVFNERQLEKFDGTLFVLRPTGAHYFVEQPIPIAIAANETTGSTAVKVSPVAVDADDNPVHFPSDLILTFYISGADIDVSKYVCAIRILRPGPPPTKRK